MQDKLNKLLMQFAGVKLVRAKLPKKITDQGGSQSSLIVEFIGPSGIGKSTLCNYYLRNHKLNFNRETISRKDLYAYAEVTRIKLTAIHERILTAKLENELASDNLLTSIKLNRVQEFRTFLEHDVLIRNYLMDKMVFLDEERLLRYFTDDKILFSKEESIAYFKNRIFVFCEASTETVRKRINKRARSGRIIKAHRNLAEDELTAYIEKQANTHQRRLEALKKFGGRSIAVNMENGLKENVKQLDAFFRNEIQ